MIHIDRIWRVTGWMLVTITVFFTLIPLRSRFLDFKMVDKVEHLIVYMILMIWFAQIARKESYRWLALGFVFMGMTGLSSCLGG